MSKILEKFTAIALWSAASCGVGFAQVAPTTILEIDVENRVSYTDDISDVSKLATDPNVTTAIPTRDFRKSITIGDIVAVNGQPAKGTFVGNFRQIFFRPEPTPGQAIADINRSSVLEFTFEILKVDGTSIGTIMAAGLGMGGAPPGAPLAVTQGNVAIVGGTGAFLGARGQLGQAVSAQSIADRQASMSEDPANRRKHGGGGRSRFLVHVTPLARPEVVITPSGPAIFHSDFSLVSAAQPARAGEVLILVAAGLGHNGQDVIAEAPGSRLLELAHRHLGPRARAVRSLGCDGGLAFAFGHHPSLIIDRHHARIAGHKDRPGLLAQIRSVPVLQEKQRLV